MELIRTLKDGTKEYKVHEKKKDNHGNEYETDYIVVRKPKEFKTRNRYPCGSADENWNEESQDWEP